MNRFKIIEYRLRGLSWPSSSPPECGNCRFDRFGIPRNDNVDDAWFNTHCGRLSIGHAPRYRPRTDRPETIPPRGHKNTKKRSRCRGELRKTPTSRRSHRGPVQKVIGPSVSPVRWSNFALALNLFSARSSSRARSRLRILLPVAATRRDEPETSQREIRSRGLETPPPSIEIIYLTVLEIENICHPYARVTRSSTRLHEVLAGTGDERTGDTEVRASFTPVARAHYPT